LRKPFALKQSERLNENEGTKKPENRHHGKMKRGPKRRNPKKLA
jgi:hypothetical protein